MKNRTFTDHRDGKEYKIVKIGSQVWMAENLNYSDKDAPGIKCYNNDPNYGHGYGRLYDWETAKKVCPPGWHLPSNAEWNALLARVGEYKTAKYLKATSGWKNYGEKSGNGDDVFGFSALPGGGYSNGNFYGVGECGGWWSASEDVSNSAYYRYIGYDEDYRVFCSSSNKSGFFSVRYLQDSRCYVATCVYGSYDCPEVWTLRRFRNNELSNSWLGRWFIRIYYATSPKIVELFGNKKWFSNLWKPILNKFVRKLQSRGIDNSPYSDIT